ncbi:MAG: DUF488 domain-containing protein [Deltaproteobacteria bacterium]|nr:DUF488 domain-containing protein [Deltaproteobacteria bacterium]
MNTPKHPVLTIGHSTHSQKAFVALLRRHNVTAVADVRSSPYSRFNPQFNKDVIECDLKEQNIKYVFLGRELGGRSDNPSCYENGRIKYTRLAQTELFKSGIERLIIGANDYRIALMCAEKEPLDCHRTLLVARVLVERGVVINHILPNGSLESHQSTMERLLDVVGLPHEDLFRSKDELVKEALALREKQVTYVNKKATNNITREML